MTDKMPFRILVVEDDLAAWQENYSRALESEDSDLTFAVNLDEALDCLDRCVISLAFVDLSLSADQHNRDGFLFLQAVRQEGDPTRTVLVTQFDELEIGTEASRDFDVSDSFAKPKFSATAVRSQVALAKQTVSLGRPAWQQIQPLLRGEQSGHEWEHELLRYQGVGYQRATANLIKALESFWPFSKLSRPLNFRDRGGVADYRPWTVLWSRRNSCALVVALGDGEDGPPKDAREQLGVPLVETVSSGKGTATVTVYTCSGLGWSDFKALYRSR